MHRPGLRAPADQVSMSTQHPLGRTMRTSWRRTPSGVCRWSVVISRYFKWRLFVCWKRCPRSHPGRRCCERVLPWSCFPFISKPPVDISLQQNTTVVSMWRNSFCLKEGGCQLSASSLLVAVRSPLNPRTLRDPSQVRTSFTMLHGEFILPEHSGARAVNY